MTTLVSLESYPNTEIKDIFIAYYKNIMSSVESEHITFEADQAPETPGQAQKKNNKTAAKIIKVASDRYYENRDKILRDSVLKNVKKNSCLPTKVSMTRHNISWEDIARTLAEDQRRNSATSKKIQKGRPIKSIEEVKNKNLVDSIDGDLPDN